MRHSVNAVVLVCLFFCVACQHEKRPPSSLNAIEEDTVDTGKVRSVTILSSTEVVPPFSAETDLPVTFKVPIPEKPRAPPPPLPLVCPGKEIRRPFFAWPCSAHQDCEFVGATMLCCPDRCMQGVLPPKPEPVHTPSWFGLVERVCPTEPLPEFLEIRQCVSDLECAPRICCQEKFPNGTVVGFCRIAQPRLDRLPAAKRFMEPIRSIISYMQCTPPPPPVLDLFPKACNSPLDCFPNLCCQEKGRRFCRPPKRSLLALVAGVSQRIIPSQAARRFIERITS